MPEKNLLTFKSKLHSTQLFKNQNIVIMKQDNDRGMVTMDKSKYQELFLMVPENENFKTLDHDLTKNRKKRYRKLQGK